MREVRAFACLIAATLIAAPAIAAPPAHKPAGKVTQWAQVVNPTPGGGFVMGNPNAKVKLIEYGSMTCSHCREFDEAGVPSLVDKYVKSGQVSWEFRNYVRDALDLTASLIARCNGAKGFFPLTRALYKDQTSWIEKIQRTPPQQLEQLQNLPPDRQFVELAKVAGFSDWAATRGVPTTKSAKCLTDQNALNQLVQMTSDATTQFPDFKGVPAFVINDKLLENTATWEALEPRLRTALGG
jgi:protein-disulfide isomerase